MPKPATWTRTARGIEIEQPRPGLVRRTLGGGAVAAVLLALVAVATTGEWRAPLWIAGFFVDRGVLALALPLLAALLWLDRASRDVVVAGHPLWVYEVHVGPLVAARHEAPAPSPAAIDVRATRADGWRVVRVDAGRPAAAARVAEALDETAARDLAQALRDLLARGAATLAVRPGPAHREWPRVLLGVLGGRLAAAIPLAIAGFGALLLATAWNLRSAQVAPVATYDAIAAGELLRFRFVLREPDAEERALGWREGVARLELGVRWSTPDGTVRESWWTSAEAVTASYLVDSRLDPLAQLIGLPAVELALPASVRPLLGPAGGKPTLAHLPASEPPGLEAAQALLAALDDPLGLFAARAGAVAPDWRVAWRRDDPARATLASLARIEADAVATLPLPLLVAAAVLGTLLLVGGSVIVLDRPRIGLLLALALLGSVPWWAAQAQRAAAWTGIEDGTANLLRELALRAGSDRAGAAGDLLQPMPPPRADPDAVVVRWDPGELPAAAVLPLLGLDAGITATGGFEQRRQAVIDHAAGRIAALDDGALVDLVRAWQAEEFGRHRALRVPYIDGLCLARAQPGRGAVARQWIEAGIRAPSLCEDG